MSELSLPGPERGPCEFCGAPGTVRFDGQDYHARCDECLEYFENDFGISAEDYANKEY